VDALRKIAQNKDLVLLDCETIGDVNFRDKPRSHTWLVKYLLDDNYAK